MREVTRTFFDRRLIEGEVIDHNINFIRNTRIILPIALSVYLYIYPSRYLNQAWFFKSPPLFEIAFLLVSLGIGYLGFRRWMSGNFSRYFVYALFLALIVITVPSLARAFFTTNSWYFFAAIAMSILMFTGHFLRSKPLSFLLILLWVVVMWCLQMPRINNREVTAFIVYFGLLIWLAVIWLAGEQKKPPLIFKGALALLLVALPIQEGSFLTMTVREQERIFSQPGVETIFMGNYNDKIPRSRMEMRCNWATGKTIVTPHASSQNAAIIDKGMVTKLTLGDESPDKSAAIGPLWVTTARGKFLLVNLDTNQVIGYREASLGDVYYLNYYPDWELLIVSQKREDFSIVNECLFFRANREGDISQINRRVYGEQCVAVSPKMVVVNKYNHRHEIALYNLETNTIVKKQPLLPLKLHYLSPFNQFAVDDQLRTIYLANMIAGIITVRNLDTLEYISRFKANPGVRNVLVDKNDHRHVFSWNYATGEVIEHRLPGGEKIRSWTLGPLLRTLNWDCDQKNLLATTAVGGFRIHLN